MKLQKQSEMQDFFNALGIDENIFEQMAETFTSNFMIEGKTTTDLNEMLSRAPESLLDVILETWEEEAPKLRAEKEKYVQELILTSFQNEFIYLDKFDMETMLRTMNGYPLSQMQMLALEENYCKKGWVFSFSGSHSSSFLSSSDKDGYSSIWFSAMSSTFALSTIPNKFKHARMERRTAAIRPSIFCTLSVSRFLIVNSLISSGTTRHGQTI